MAAPNTITQARAPKFMTRKNNQSSLELKLRPNLEKKLKNPFFPFSLFGVEKYQSSYEICPSFRNLTVYKDPLNHVTFTKIITKRLSLSNTRPAEISLRACFW